MFPHNPRSPSAASSNYFTPMISRSVSPSGSSDSYVTPASIQSERCAICLEDLVPIPTVELLCKHSFHQGCVNTWLAANPTCPICRALVPRDPGFSNESRGAILRNPLLSAAVAAFLLSLGEASPAWRHSAFAIILAFISIAVIYGALLYRLNHLSGQSYTEILGNPTFWFDILLTTIFIEATLGISSLFTIQTGVSEFLDMVMTGGSLALINEASFTLASAIIGLWTNYDEFRFRIGEAIFRILSSYIPAAIGTVTAASMMEFLRSRRSPVELRVEVGVITAGAVTYTSSLVVNLLAHRAPFDLSSWLRHIQEIARSRGIRPSAQLAPEMLAEQGLSPFLNEETSLLPRNPSR